MRSLDLNELHNYCNHSRDHVHDDDLRKSKALLLLENHFSRQIVSDFSGFASDSSKVDADLRCHLNNFLLIRNVGVGLAQSHYCVINSELHNRLIQICAVTEFQLHYYSNSPPTLSSNGRINIVIIDLTSSNKFYSLRQSDSCASVLLLR